MRKHGIRLLSTSQPIQYLASRQNIADPAGSSSASGQRRLFFRLTGLSAPQTAPWHEACWGHRTEPRGAVQGAEP